MLEHSFSSASAEINMLRFWLPSLDAFPHAPSSLSVIPHPCPSDTFLDVLSHVSTGAPSSSLGIRAPCIEWCKATRRVLLAIDRQSYPCSSQCM